MKELNLDEQKQILLVVLKEIDAFCNKANITYYLDSGTLLGAVRHRGYIPWDDDIDLAMPRADYEKFLSLFNSEKCTVFSFWTNKDYYYQFAKVVYNGSVVFEPNIPEIKGLGINIDIFPLDGMPDRLIGRRIHQDLLMFLNKLKAANVRLKFKAPSALKFFFRWRLLIRVIDMLGKRFSMDNTNYCGNIIVTTVRHKEIPIECFENTEWLDFENRKYPVPSGYDEYLKRLYGDYMKLPPKEKQIASHNVKAFLVT